MALIDGLVHYWKLDVNESPQTDEVGSSNLTVTNATFTGSGKINGGYVLNGTNAYLSDTTLDISGDNTFSCNFWMKDNSGGSGVKRWFSGLTNHGSLGSAWMLLRELNNEVQFYVNGASVATSGAAGSWKGPWNMWTIVSDGSDTRLYLNNALLLTNAASVNPQAGLWLGSNKSGEFMAADWDEVGIWNRALSSDERTEIYNTGAGLAYPFSTGAVDNAIFHGNNF